MKTIFYNFLTGLIACCLAFLLAFLVTNDKFGVRIDKSLLSDAAIQILNETPNEPLTADQLKRFNKAYINSPAYNSSKLWAKELGTSWYWFILLPSLFLAFKLAIKKPLDLLNSIIVVLPSFTVLLFIATNI